MDYCEYYCDYYEYEDDAPKVEVEEVEEVEETPIIVKETEPFHTELYNLVNSVYPFKFGTKSAKYDFVLEIIYSQPNPDVRIELLLNFYYDLNTVEFETLLGICTLEKTAKSNKKKNYDGNVNETEKIVKKDKKEDKLESLKNILKVLKSKSVDKCTRNFQIIDALTYLMIECMSDTYTCSKVIKECNKLIPFIIEFDPTKKVVLNQYIESVNPDYFMTCEIKNHAFMNDKCVSTRTSNIYKHYDMIKKADLHNVYFAFDENKCHLFKFMIIGPKNTPYENGFYVFDGILTNFPRNPPKIQFMTTGGGTVRFNPNLYHCGKVCLSLLGTWTGPKWTSESTLLQIILSIQSMILVEEPYYNEPGHSLNKIGSERYNETVRYNNKKVAIDDVIRNKHLWQPFTDVIDKVSKTYNT